MITVRRGRRGSGKGVVWVLVSCPSVATARRLGGAALRQRQAACFNIFPRLLARYFWPPRRGTTEDARGALLVLETLARQVGRLKAIVRSHHPEQLPFVGVLYLGQVERAYRDWLAGELRT